MKDYINLRIKAKGCELTAIPDRETLAQSMRIDVRKLAKEWLPQVSLNPETLERAECEFILQSTLDYIEELESVLQGLQADPDTPDELLEQIEKVLK